MTKIKLSYIVSSLVNEGPVNVMYNIIQHIDFETFDVSIITLIPEKENSRFFDFKKLPIKIIQVSPNKALSPINLYRRLKDVLGKISPQLIHAHCPRSLFLMYFLPAKYKKIYTAHIYPGIQQKALYGTIKGIIVTKLLNFFMNKTEYPIACSYSVRDQFKENQGWEIDAIQNGCSLPVWDRDENERQSLRNKLGFQDNVKYFIFIGRLSKEKRPDYIVDIFSKMKNLNIGLIILGDGPLYNEIKNKESDYIKIAGFKTNIYDYLKASDYYISPSLVEGLANTLLESMSVGLPMVLSNIPSHKEVIGGSDKFIGLLFEDSEESLVECVSGIIKCNINVCSKDIQDYYNSSFTSQKMSNEYQKRYLRINNIK